MTMILTFWVLIMALAMFLVLWFRVCCLLKTTTFGCCLCFLGLLIKVWNAGFGASRASGP